MKKILIGVIIGVLISGTFTVLATSTLFTDTLGDEWFNDSLVSLVNKEIVKGYNDGSFKPGNNVNRAELTVITDRTINYLRARELAIAFLEWSERQAVPQEIFIDEKQVIKSGPNAGGYSPPEFDIDGIKVLADKISEYSAYEYSGDSDYSVYECIRWLKESNEAKCLPLGSLMTITTKDTDFGPY